MRSYYGKWAERYKHIGHQVCVKLAPQRHQSGTFFEIICTLEGLKCCPPFNRLVCVSSFLHLLFGIVLISKVCAHLLCSSLPLASSSSSGCVSTATDAWSVHSITIGARKIWAVSSCRGDIIWLHFPHRRGPLLSGLVYQCKSIDTVYTQNGSADTSQQHYKGCKGNAEESADMKLPYNDCILLF